MRYPFSFENAETWFKTVISEMFSLAEPRVAYSGIPRGTSISYFPSQSRATIMASARMNRRLQFVYDGLVRVVEPYALVFKRRRDGVGREYFYGWDCIGGRSGEVGIKSYIADKVHSVTILEETFVPRFPVELTKSSGYFGESYFSGSRGSSSQRTRRAVSTSGIDYTVECPYCKKRFKRTSYDTKLNDHKDRYGNRCPGRMGYLV